MIALIILTGIAIFVLLIGFFEIRIPFLFRDQLTKKEKSEFFKAYFAKEQKKVNSKMKNIRSLLKGRKEDVSYRMLNKHHTSDAI